MCFAQPIRKGMFGLKSATYIHTKTYLATVPQTAADF